MIVALSAFSGCGSGESDKSSATDGGASAGGAAAGRAGSGGAPSGSGPAGSGGQGLAGASSVGGGGAAGGALATAGQGGVTTAAGAGGAGGSGGAAAGSGGAGGSIGLGLTGPCDIYKGGRTPCVTAHSTLRALFGAYDGKLYQIRNAAGATKEGATGKNQNVPIMKNTFVTAMEKNNGTTEFAIRGGDATTGALTTLYKGKLPNGYNPMKKQGAIVLGSGGDCCLNVANGAAGTFYEGCIVAGYPTDATEEAVQANIVAAKYSK